MAKESDPAQADDPGPPPPGELAPQATGAVPAAGDAGVPGGAADPDETEEDAEAKSRRAFFGRSGQLAVMAEFLHRRINVAKPEVDVGDDLFVVRGLDATVTRVQVKAATATEQATSFYAKVNVPLAQLSVPRDNPPLVYVFPIRRPGRWAEFIVIRRSALDAIREDGAGTRLVGRKGVISWQFRIVFKEKSAPCGPDEAADFQPYRNAWEPWPPAEVVPAQPGGATGPEEAPGSDEAATPPPPGRAIT